MSYNVKQFVELIIEPVLKDLDMYSESAVNLILGTMAQESFMGHYLKQLGNGPALGGGQMEPVTHDDIWKNYLKYRPALAEKVEKYLVPNDHPYSGQMVYNLKYMVAMMRVFYFRVPEKLPAANDEEALGVYWKKHYNTEEGKGTVEEFVHNYGKYVA